MYALFTVEPVGAGYTVTFTAPDIANACERARHIANDRMRRRGAEWRLYDDDGVRLAEGDRWGVRFV